MENCPLVYLLSEENVAEVDAAQSLVSAYCHVDWNPNVNCEQGIVIEMPKIKS